MGLTEDHHPPKKFIQKPRNNLARLDQKMSRILHLPVADEEKWKILFKCWDVIYSTFRSQQLSINQQNHQNQRFSQLWESEPQYRWHTKTKDSSLLIFYCKIKSYLRWKRCLFDWWKIDWAYSKPSHTVFPRILFSRGTCTLFIKQYCLFKFEKKT